MLPLVEFQGYIILLIIITIGLFCSRLYCIRTYDRTFLIQLLILQTFGLQSFGESLDSPILILAVVTSIIWLIFGIYKGNNVIIYQFSISIVLYILAAAYFCYYKK